MSDIVIRAENLSKQYRIGGIQPRYKTFREWLTEATQTPVRRLSNVIRGKSALASDETIWALKDVSFEVKRGEVVGVIGRNGAGKTTLLKILTRVTEPTEGRARIRGRVGSLLEVGTGFHPELTGRENTYLNGAILGMRRAEIDSRFDEIVSFAEIEKFIDTPVKHYSSGMYVRLAFAVAAHMESEILLVDEVLAVGDAAFQRKCLGKMGEVAKEGRTVFLVSHNMAAILAMCSRSLLLSRGRLEIMADTATVVQEYQSSDDLRLTVPLADRKDRRGNRSLLFTQLSFVGNGFRSQSAHLSSGQVALFIMRCRSATGEPLRDVAISVKVRDMAGSLLFTCPTNIQGTYFDEFPPECEVLCEIPMLPLIPGLYQVDLWSAVGRDRADYIENAGQFEVMASDYYGSGKLPVHHKHGPILVPHTWSIKR